MAVHAKALIAAVALLVGVGVGAGAGWVAQDWRLTGIHAEELAKRYREALAMANGVMEIGRAANAVISAADQRAWKGMQSDKKELDDLRKCVAAGTCGVRIIAKPATPSGDAIDSGAGSMGDDTIALDPDVQRRVLDLREAIGEDQRKIEYLQDYIQQCWASVNLKTTGQ